MFLFSCCLILGFVFVGFGGPGGGFGGFLLSSRSGGFATTFTTNRKAAKTTGRTIKTNKNTTKNTTKRKSILFYMKKSKKSNVDVFY